jgi:hypothetical protein
MQQFHLYCQNPFSSNRDAPQNLNAATAISLRNEASKTCEVNPTRPVTKLLVIYNTAITDYR